MSFRAGITDYALALMKSYLDGRQQCVQIEGVISKFAELVCGVPQGSVLGRVNSVFICYR